MPNTDPRTWPPLAPRYRVLSIVVFVLAAIAYAVVGLASALCLVVVSAACLLSAPTAAATGQLSILTKVVIALGVVGFAATLVLAALSR
jgi:hypothetical protein